MWSGHVMCSDTKGILIAYSIGDMRVWTMNISEDMFVLVHAKA